MTMMEEVASREAVDADEDQPFLIVEIAIMTIPMNRKVKIVVLEDADEAVVDIIVENAIITKMVNVHSVVKVIGTAQIVVPRITLIEMNVSAAKRLSLKVQAMKVLEKKRSEKFTFPKNQQMRNSFSHRQFRLE